MATYIVTFAFCGVGIAYESSMMCGKSDCLYSALVASSEGEPMTAEDRAAIGRVALYGKVRQQLSIALGLTQLVTIVALYFRMKNIVQFLAPRGSPRGSAEVFADNPDPGLAETEAQTRRMYFTVFALFTALAVALVPSNLYLVDSWRSVYTVVLLLELIGLSILLAVYLKLLVDRIDEINHLNFITEKKILFCTSTVFVATTALRALLSLVTAIDPGVMSALGAYPVVLVEAGKTVLFEIVPMAVIQVQHLKNRERTDPAGGRDTTITESHVSQIGLAELKCLPSGT